MSLSHKYIYKSQKNSLKLIYFSVSVIFWLFLGVILINLIEIYNVNYGYQDVIAKKNCGRTSVSHRS